MPPYKFYLSDDELPLLKDGLLRNEDIIRHSALKCMLADDEYGWPDETVRDLLQKAVDQDQWQVTAARNPEFLLKEFETSLDRPDVLVFDWDYQGLPKPAEDYLAEFLSKTYCIVQIYSGADMKDAIQAVIQKDRFSAYQSRLLLSEKREVTPEELLKTVEKQYKDNFSYRFGAQLRNATARSLEEILVSLGRNSIDQVLALLHAQGTTEGDFKELFIEKLRNHLREDAALLKRATELGVKGDHAQVLIDLVAEKLRNDLNSEDLKLAVSGRGIPDADEKVKEAAAKLWSYRLDYKLSDDCVRRGDIARKTETAEMFVVVSADCDLNRLWDKNYGYVNLVPIYQITKTSEELKKRLELAKITAGNLDFKVGSLATTPQKLSDGTLLLPFIPVESALLDFLVFPKEIASVEVPGPAEAEGDINKLLPLGLSYSRFGGFKRVCTLSEPFLTPFIITLLDTLAGQGVPDYPRIVKGAIHDRSKKALT